MKLGITVSERTVSRYLCDRLRGPSQTSRTFFANHFGALTFSSIETSSDAPGDDDVSNAVMFPLRSARALGDRPSYRWTVVDWSQSRTPLGPPDAQADLHPRTRTGAGSGRGPPKSWAVTTRSRTYKRRVFRRDTSSRSPVDRSRRVARSSWIAIR